MHAWIHNVIYIITLHRGAPATILSIFGPNRSTPSAPTVKCIRTFSPSRSSIQPSNQQTPIYTNTSVVDIAIYSNMEYTSLCDHSFHTNDHAMAGLDAAVLLHVALVVAVLGPLHTAGCIIGYHHIRKVQSLSRCAIYRLSRLS